MNNSYKYEEKEKLIDDINKLTGYEGFVQFSYRAIDKDRDIFLNTNPDIKDKEGFIYEAHFANTEESIMIRQLNEGWLVSKTDISNIDKSDTEEYASDIKGFNYAIKMAQIWKSEADELCDGMNVMKLQKVLFAGFLVEKKEGEAS